MMCHVCYKQHIVPVFGDLWNNPEVSYSEQKKWKAEVDQDPRFNVVTGRFLKRPVAAEKPKGRTVRNVNENSVQKKQKLDEKDDN